MMRNNDKKTNAPVNETMQGTTEDDVKIYVQGKQDPEPGSLEYYKQLANDAITANKQLMKDYYELKEQTKDFDRKLAWSIDKAERAERGAVKDNTPTLRELIDGAETGRYVLDLHIRISSKNPNKTEYGLTWSDEEDE